MGWCACGCTCGRAVRRGVVTSRDMVHPAQQKFAATQPALADFIDVERQLRIATNMRVCRGKLGEANDGGKNVVELVGDAGDCT